MPPPPSGISDESRAVTLKIRGLRQRADLNGRFAEMLNVPARADGRVPVHVCTTGERVWVKAENVAPVQTEWIEGEEGHPFPAKYGTEQWYKSVDGARRLENNAECYICSFASGKRFEVWTPQWLGPRKEPTAPAPTMGIGEGTDDDPFAGLKQHMEADGFDTLGMQTFSLKPGAHGTGATLEECLANAQASTQ